MTEQSFVCTQGNGRGYWMIFDDRPEHVTVEPPFRSLGLIDGCERWTVILWGDRRSIVCEERADCREDALDLGHMMLNDWPQ